MQVYRDISALPDKAKGAVTVIGNMDGMHVGHQALVGEGAVFARRNKALLSVLTFEPHPRRYFAPDSPPFRLTGERQKLRRMKPGGVDQVIILPFTDDLAEMSAEAFVEELLIGKLEAGHLVIGDDFRFGKGRSGDGALMRRVAEKHGTSVTVMEEVLSHDGLRASSTRIREALAEGWVNQANLLLGRPFEIEGEVMKGDQRGATIGFATANLDLANYIRPKYGVYAVRAALVEKPDPDGTDTHSGWVHGVANLGRRPTVDGTREWLEVHLFDFDKDIYGKTLRVQLIDFIRAEQRFDGIDELVTQIGNDSKAAKHILAENPMVQLNFE
ncbi:MAG: bifunctional riboflavin kinase/FAD synthetase [Alphaproteobacteria bacterium]